MKKRNAQALSEILATDITVIGDNVEAFQQHLYRYVLGMTSGVITGLATTISTSGTIEVSVGSLVDNTYAYGELETASGSIAVSIPSGGTRTDTVSARFLEVPDTPGASYVLIDVESRTETTSNVYRRNFGSIQIEVHENTASGALTGNRIPISSLSVTSGGIQSVTDLRTFVKPTNVDTTSLALGGDINGTASSATVAKIQGISVDTTDPTDGQVLEYVSVSGKYVPKTPAAAPTSLSQGGDISGTTDNATVDKIKNITISGTPGAGKALVNDGTNFVHTVVPTGSIDLTAIPTGNIQNFNAAVDARAVNYSAGGPGGFRYFTDCFTTFTNGVSTDGWYGASIFPTSIIANAGHPGIWALQVGTNTAAYAKMYYDNSYLNTVLLGGGTWTLEALIYLGQLSDATNEHDFRFGMMDIVNSEPTNGVYFEYDRNNSTNWRICTANASTYTRTNTSTTVTGTTWIKLRIEINAAANSVTFYINGTSVGTIATNIPTANGVFPVISVIKSASNTDKNIYIDYIDVQHTLTVSR